MTHTAFAHQSDRRKATRFDGPGLVANINGMLVDVRNISVGGAKVARLITPPKGDISIALLQRGEHRLDLTGSVSVTGSVVHVGKDSIHLRFETATFALSKMIVAHAGRLLGITPYSVK